jgi:antitoxin component YwqK of YwqJK toxin-antitoxin module
MPLALAIMLPACRGASQARLSCPPGHTLMGAAPPKGEEVWCQKLVDGKPVKDGLFIVYQAGGNSKMLQGNYSNGLQDGEWTMWYETGQRSSVDHYRNGLQDGLHTSWYANGAMALTGQYRDGKRVGVWTTWDPSGLTSRKQDYNAKVPG